MENAVHDEIILTPVSNDETYLRLIKEQLKQRSRQVMTSREEQTSIKAQQKE